ncbi:MAG: aldose 1-epimerase family protein [Chitinophagaceae bacterium]
MITLQNEFVSATIAPKGAELQSFKNKETDIEYMWSGDAAYWGKVSPVLFPIVGTLIDDTYFYKGQPYKLPRHGFAREQEFEARQLSETEAVFTLKDSKETLKVYPFSFEFRLRYKLDKSSVSCTYEVHNPGSNDLLFSVGGHPAFAVPFNEDTRYEDYFLQFVETESLKRYKLENGLIGEATEIIAMENGQLPLSPSLFYEDAIVLKHLQSQCIVLGSDEQPHGLHFCFTDFPFFGIWAAKDAPFICLEPWCGIADHTTHNQQLQDKEGVIALAPNANWQRTWSVGCF